MIVRKSGLIALSQFFIFIVGWIWLILLAKLWGGFTHQEFSVIGVILSYLIIFQRYHMIVFAKLGLGIYFAFLRLFREFRKQDFYFSLEIFRNKVMLGYIKSELNEKQIY